MTADLDAVQQSILRLRRSPLAHRAAELAACTGSVALAEVPFLSMVNLRVAPGSDAALRVQQALGVELPEPGSVQSIVVAAKARSVLWLGPDEWLVVGPDGDVVNLIRLLVEAMGGHPGSVVDVSASRTTLVISGPSARDLLEKGCTLDLHPRSFGPGRCAQTTFARGHILLWQIAAEPAADEPAADEPAADEPAADEPATAEPAADEPAGWTYRLLLGSSFADYFADWLLDAATEFTLV